MWAEVTGESRSRLNASEAKKATADTGGGPDGRTDTRAADLREEKGEEKGDMPAEDMEVADSKGSGALPVGDEGGGRGGDGWRRDGEPTRRENRDDAESRRSSHLLIYSTSHAAIPHPTAGMGFASHSVFSLQLQPQ